MLLIRALIAYLSMLSKSNGLDGDALSEIEMWLPATRMEPRIVLHHKRRAIFELLFLSGASFVSLPLSLPRCDEPRVPGQEGSRTAGAPRLPLGAPPNQPVLRLGGHIL